MTAIMQNIVFLPSTGQLAMPNFFFRNYNYNDTNERKKNKPKENLYIYTLMHTRQTDLFNFKSY